MSEITDKWRKLRQEMGNLICEVDGKTEKLEAEERRMEQKRDESYLKGTEDMRKAVNMLYDACHIGLTPQKMEDLFGTNYIPSILGRFPAITVIDGLKRFLKEKEQEFQVGDEVECIDPLNMQYGKKCVVLRIREELKLLDLSNFSIYYSTNFSNYRKTGKRYSFEPIPFEKTCTEGENK